MGSNLQEGLGVSLSHYGAWVWGTASQNQDATPAASPGVGLGWGAATHPRLDLGGQIWELSLHGMTAPTRSIPLYARHTPYTLVHSFNLHNSTTIPML